ncbi:HEPN domain-containing protein [Salinibacter ruber]|uniref:HEPN domain-containing protein n=1 Tax=Salinibacter ruber TaxID=146919 RepID=UPI0020734255|nr:HEPN domain-containing protein [Salinibacter ruber]MCS4114613.1 HEPN domain-containing protein [Salinibacter ruber]MCS4181754.1 HEPN domain-containing protein [Salinibacter ruber]
MQQSVEKRFKAILEEREEEIPHIHNLVTLRERTGISVEEAELNVMDRLNRLYIGARYPGERGLLPGGKPSPEEAKQFQRVATRIYDRVSSWLGEP